MVKEGLVTAEEYDRFCGALQNLADRDQYFYAITMFSFVGARRARKTAS